MSERVVTGHPALSGDSLSFRSTPLDRAVLRRVQAGVASAPLRFVLWDGFECQPLAGEPPIATLLFKDRLALYGVAWQPDFYLGESYMAGTLEIRGDLLATLEAVYRALAWRPRPRWLWQPPNGLGASRQNVHHHYDLGNAFYRLWLDRQLLYTCAYFPTPDSSLEDAQVAKMALVCRKLRLSPGDRVVEVGCGWGHFALFMARHHGVTVRAYNVSAEQIAYARKMAKAEGLEGRVEFVDDDYRGVRGEYDVFVSVGMLEHVGRANLPVLGRVIDGALGARGRAFLHFIGRNQPAPLNPWIRRRIFPGAYAPTLPEVFASVLEPYGFSVLDVENLRLHYAKTLDHWRQRFERESGEVARMFDDRFLRAWRLYLTGSQASFSTGSLQLFQVLFARGDSNAIPWTRAEP